MSDVENEFPETIEFVSGAVKFKYENAEITLKRPSALQSVAFQKEMNSMDKEDLEAMIKFYIKVLISQGMVKETAESLDLFSLGDVFRALNSQGSKKK